MESAKKMSGHTNIFLLVAVIFFLIPSPSIALDKNGNFESKQEQDAFISTTLKNMAGELNAQTPIQLDEGTRMMSVIALQKTITFNMRLTNYNSLQVDPNNVAQIARENLNHTVCQNKATRNLIDMGVQYIYLYTDNDGKLITRVVINSYRC